VRAKLPTRPTRAFWWDRELRTDADVLRAVIFDADSALAHIDRGRDAAARTDLIDSVMSLFVAGIWVSVVSAGPRVQVETMVRQLLGDGMVETIVTIDDLPQPSAELARGGELYRLALWEMGITARGALAVTGPGAGLRSSTAAGLPTVVVDEVSAASCRQAHRRWWIRPPGDDAERAAR
jgi:beta-phosphoglucomutase-like phosphatase (HAD superfamily)